MEWPCSRRPPADTPVTTPEPQGNLAVVPLIGDKRYYGEVPLRFRCSPGEIGGMVLSQGINASRLFRLLGDDFHQGDLPGLRL